MLTGVLKPDEALAGFGYPVVWLIVSAFFISRGFLVTSLGLRIAYLFMAAVGKKSLGLAYSMIGFERLAVRTSPSTCRTLSDPATRYSGGGMGFTPAP